MQSEDVPDSVRKAFFPKMSAELMASLNAGPFLRYNLSLCAEADVEAPELCEETAEEDAT
jgi:hypothetical protein